MILILSLKTAQVGTCSLVCIRKYCSITSADQNPRGSGNHLLIRHLFIPKPCCAVGCPLIYLLLKPERCKTAPNTQARPQSGLCLPHSHSTESTPRETHGNAQALGGTPGAHTCSIHCTSLQIREPLAVALQLPLSCHD